MAVRKVISLLLMIGILSSNLVTDAKPSSGKSKKGSTKTTTTTRTYSSGKTEKIVTKQSTQPSTTPGKTTTTTTTTTRTGSTIPSSVNTGGSRTVVIQTPPAVMPTPHFVYSPGMVAPPRGYTVWVPQTPKWVNPPINPYNSFPSRSAITDLDCKKIGNIGIVKVPQASTKLYFDWNCATNVATNVMYRPDICFTNPAASWLDRNQFYATTYSYNCAYNQQMAVDPTECYTRPTSTIYSTNPQAIDPRMKYTRYDCKYHVGPTPASASGAGVIIGVIIGICICLCIVGAVCGNANKGEDGDVHEQLIEEETTVVEVHHEEAEAPVMMDQQPGMYPQPGMGYQQPGMGYQQMQMQPGYVPPAGTYYGQDMQTGQPVVQGTIQ